MTLRQIYSLTEIKDMLHDRIAAVADRYAPPAKGSFTDKGRYFTLNPGRPDRTVGSFFIHMSGGRVGHWHDFATNEGGDVLDLIRLSLNLPSLSAALAEARAFLGLATDTPEQRAARERAALEMKARRAAAEREERRTAERRCKQAEALYLSAREGLAGTPVQLYLARRGIDLTALVHPPRALRYHHQVGYFREETDPETGEVTSLRGTYPAMLAALVNGRGRITGCHRTYLAHGPGGWAKADLPDQKKVLGQVRGSAIRLSSGIGPRGGKGVPLANCPPGTRVVIGEGIETCLAAMVLWPQERVLAAYSLGNLSQVELPANVHEVVLLSDHDASPQAAAAFEAAIQAHAKAGRRVRVWQSETPREDMADALLRVQAEAQGAA
jgi:hypothetical protein